MSIYILAPLVVVVCISLICLNAMISLRVAERMEKTGFAAFFLIVTLIGQFAFEISLFFYLHLELGMLR